MTTLTYHVRIFTRQKRHCNSGIDATAEKRHECLLVSGQNEASHCHHTTYYLQLVSNETQDNTADSVAPRRYTNEDRNCIGSENKYD